MHTQEEAIAAIKRGDNVFISGSAGVGKSYVINNSINRKTTVIAAPTGIAALNVGGETCHSLFGLPTGLPSEKDKFFIPPKMKEIFGEGSNVTTVVIDEISMLRADYFDLISDKLKIVKGNDLPFGGLQIIIVGDLFQLPPILTKEESKLYRRMRYKSVWVFHSKCFEACNFTNIVLSKIYRQDNKEQIEVLNGIRQGINLDYNISKINEWCTKDLQQERLNLCTYNKDADRINVEQFKKNPNTIKIYEAEVKNSFKASDCIVPKTLELKKGLRVIICANGDEYRNGEMGVILTLEGDSITVKKDNGKIVEVEPFTWDALSYTRGLKGELKKSTKGSMTQFPVKMGYAISIHKSQGMTLDNLYIDFGYKVRSEGLAYVALSRARDLNNIYLKRKLEKDDILIDRHVKKYYQEISNETK
jgi:ATP-dependent exoDNAse (exonuclease V) alpha subunit